MLDAAEQIKDLVKSECDRASSPGARRGMERHLVEPVHHLRTWEYSAEPCQYPCWLIAKLGKGEVHIVFSEYGHGRTDHWGVVTPDSEFFGMDSSWFLTLEDAFINSGFWEGPIPEEYEVK